MNASTFIALRYLKANRENRFVSWIALLSVGGIAISVAAMIVVLAVINGFESELRNRFLAANAHVLVYRFPAGMRQYPEMQREIGATITKEMSGSAPFIHGDTMGRKNYAIHSMLIKGIYPRLRADVQPVDDVIRPLLALDELKKEIDLHEAGKPLPEETAIILGHGLALTMEVKIGDTVELIAPSTGESQSLTAMRKFRVVGFYDSGLQHYDNKIGIMSLTAAQELFSMGDLVTGIEIGLHDPEESVAVAQKIRENFNLSVKEWQSYNRNIFEAMKNERLVISLIVALVALVASFNILTTLFILVTQKQRDISILKALGAHNGFILRLFLKQGMFIGIAGSLGGVVLGFIISKLLEKVPFIELPDIYMLATLPINYDWRIYVGVASSAVLIASVAGFYPSWAAARITPTDGLRLGGRR
jgi:lipoprotein-releasing system permease protein